MTGTTSTPAAMSPSGSAAGTIVSLSGAVISSTISDLTPHVWTAGANGLFHTATDLSAEWKGYYQAMLQGGAAAAALTAVQRLEGNAEAVFENTGLAALSTAVQERDREDAQREFDAIAAAMAINAGSLGIDPSKPFTDHAYLAMEQTLQGNATLEELAIQGHGLNNPASMRYRGYTNDFQHNVDNHTLFVGSGLNHDEKAIADLFDDSILSHAPFEVVVHNGQLTQLNQNATRETKLARAVAAQDDMMFGRVLTAADFSTQPAAEGTGTQPYLATALTQPTPGAGQLLTLYGDVVATTINGTPHVWTADAIGLFHTSANLANEWRSDYAALQSGGAGLTVGQRLAGNAEAILENTALATARADHQNEFREDLQREYDAIDGAMAEAGLDAHGTFATATYLETAAALDADPALRELELEGHGLNKPPSDAYRGYTSDFQNRADRSTLYVGSGPDSGQNAIADFLDDVVLTHLGFAVGYHNGTPVQLNQNGAIETSLTSAVSSINFSLTTVLGPSDFRRG